MTFMRTSSSDRRQYNNGQRGQPAETRRSGQPTTSRSANPQAQNLGQLAIKVLTNNLTDAERRGCASGSRLVALGFGIGAAITGLTQLARINKVSCLGMDILTGMTVFMGAMSYDCLKVARNLEAPVVESQQDLIQLVQSWANRGCRALFQDEGGAISISESNFRNTLVLGPITKVLSALTITDKQSRDAIFNIRARGALAKGIGAMAMVTAGAHVVRILAQLPKHSFASNFFGLAMTALSGVLSHDLYRVGDRVYGIGLNATDQVKMAAALQGDQGGEHLTEGTLLAQPLYRFYRSLAS